MSSFVLFYNEINMKFNITSILPPFEPTERKFIEFPFDVNISQNTEKGLSNAFLLITPQAKLQIFEHIFWGDSNSTNNVEQGGLLIGKSYIDNYQNIKFGIVERVICAKTAIGTSAYLQIGHETWKSMIDEFDIFSDLYTDKNIQIVGWYHTHPKMTVFMSGTDRNTQEKMFSKDWQYSIVLNPQRQIWRAFNGKDANECNGYFLSNPLEL